MVRRDPQFLLGPVVVRGDEIAVAAVVSLGIAGMLLAFSATPTPW